MALAAFAAHGEVIGARVVDALDLQVAPNKYKNKGIEVRGVRCFHADEKEYRCIHPGANLMIMGVDIEPASAKSSLEENCGEIKKVLTSPKCRYNIRLYPVLVEEDEVGGGDKRTVIGTKMLEIVK
jgi:hypothetical protein